MLASDAMSLVTFRVSSVLVLPKTIGELSCFLLSLVMDFTQAPVFGQN